MGGFLLCDIVFIVFLLLVLFLYFKCSHTKAATSTSVPSPRATLCAVQHLLLASYRVAKPGSNCFYFLFLAFYQSVLVLSNCPFQGNLILLFFIYCCIFIFFYCHYTWLWRLVLYPLIVQSAKAGISSVAMLGLSCTAFRSPSFFYWRSS